MSTEPARARVAFARCAWGCWLILSVLSLAALAPLGAGVLLGGPLPALAAAALAAPLALPLALVLRLALPAAAAPLAALRRGDLPATAARRSVAAAAALVTLELAAGAAAWRWSERHDLAEVVRDMSLGACLALVLAGGSALLRRRRPAPPALLLVAAAAPLLPPLARAWAWPAHLLAHPAAPWALLLAALLPYAGRAPAPPRWAALTAALVALVALAHLALRFGASPGLAALLQGRHAPIRAAVALGRWATDLDADGSAAWFGGRDCAPLDPRRGPRRGELAGNGLDDNCLLGDLLDDRERPAPPSGAPPLAWPRPLSVLLITVDALRADRTSIEGYARPTTPHLERRFAREVRFTRAYSEAAATRETLPSLLSGRRIFELVWHTRRALVLDPATRTAADTFAARGRATIAVAPQVAFNMIGANNLGFADATIYDPKQVVGEGVSERTLAAIDRAAGPFFAWAHYFEPHEPYRRHARFAAVSSAAYDQEVAQVDAAIEALLAGLERRGRLDDTIVVVTADHGEAFGEHGYRFHGHGVHEEDVRVPLLMKLPGVPGRTIDRPVSTTALVATLHDLLGWPLPEVQPPTVPSLWPLILGLPADPEPVVVSAAWDLPGERLGRQGDENFCSSVLIGVREPTNIILRYVGDDPANAGHWRYGIVNGAESAIVAEFATLAELLAHLRPERPLPASRVPGMAKAKVTTKRRRS